MAIFPFTEDVDSLIDGMDAIPIDPEVPCAQKFQEILIEHSGNPWGPNATARSKLATRLHFAGWSRQELEQVGLKPKDVENFRQKFGLKVSKRASRRPRNPSVPEGTKRPLFNATEPAVAIRLKQQALEAEIKHLEQRIADSQVRIEECREELKKYETAMKVIST